MDINELRKKMKSVPFGNSVFQNTNFTAGKETPERRYRHCLLQINEKLNSLKECEFNRKRTEVDIEELQEKLSSESITKYERKRFEIDLEEKEFRLENEIKLIEDALIELKTYEKELESLPEITREEFENSELRYWKLRLVEDAMRETISTGTISTGTIQSLSDIGIGVRRSLEKGLEIVGELEAEHRASLGGSSETKGTQKNVIDFNKPK